MIEVEAQGTIFFQFHSLQMPGLFHGIFSRKGGVSPAPWASLNLGGTVGDEPANVRKNLSRVLSASGFSQEQLVQVKQIHSSTVVKALQGSDATHEGDAITTDQRGLLLLMRFADCVPILFFDPVNSAIAIAHAGWKGTLNGVVTEVVKAMSQHYGTSPDELQVGIGPSIGPDHYQIGSDVIKKAKRAFPHIFEEIILQDGDQVKLDLWNANRIHLEQMGVRQIEMANQCTGCDLVHWYSHRAEKGKTGRFGAVIGLL
jgi:YfiH family protein